MTLVSLSDVSVTFGGTTILRDVSLVVAKGTRWGVVGRNGAGKTTIFRLMTGELAPTLGTVTRAPTLQVALLDQHREFGAATTVWEAAASGFARAIDVQHRLDELGARLDALGDRVTEADLARYGRVQEEFVHLGGYDFHARVDAVLQGLGFEPEDARTRPLHALSGGERGRVGLAAQLAAPADLRLFDEPTNHLDLDTTQWLTDYLRDAHETVMIISHDRAFLDDTVEHTLHVHGRTAVSYRGGYSSFARQRAERELSQTRAVAKQEAYVRKEEDYIRRNIAGQNTAQAKGRRKRLARLPRLAPPAGEDDSMALRLEAGERGGNLVLEMRDLRVTIGERTLLDEVHGTAMRGDVIALVGANGTGKSTLLATILGVRPPASGEARIGASIDPAWYRQDLAGVPLDRTIFDVIHDLRPQWNRGHVQGHLGKFRFSGDEVQRATRSLSGGERARVALAMITLAKANLLVLDEPTNHLDVEGIEVLEDAIEQYDGTVILVSHDRAFLRELATRVWAIDGERLEIFDAPFIDWEVARAERAQRAKAADSESRARAAAQSSAKRQRPDSTIAAARVRRSAEQAVKVAERNVQEAEARITALEAELADGAIYDGSAEGNHRAAALGRALAEARTALTAAMALWAQAAEELERHKE